MGGFGSKSTVSCDDMRLASEMYEDRVLPGGWGCSVTGWTSVSFPAPGGRRWPSSCASLGCFLLRIVFLCFALSSCVWRSFVVLGPMDMHGTGPFWLSDGT